VGFGMMKQVPKLKITNLDKNGNKKRICDLGISDVCKKRKLSIPYSDKAMFSVTRNNVWICVECFEIKLNKKIPKKDWQGIEK
jgi:hypothetical protein